MTIDVHKLKQDIITKLDILSPQSLQLLAEFAQFLWQKGTLWTTQPKEEDNSQISAELSNAWEVLETFTGSVDAPADWSIEHNHYLYNTPKQQKEKAV